MVDEPRLTVFELAYAKAGSLGCPYEIRICKESWRESVDRRTDTITRDRKDGIGGDECGFEYYRENKGEVVSEVVDAEV